VDIYTGTYKNIKCYYVENEIIKLAVLPELGAKIASLVYKPQNFEVLFQPTQGMYQIPEYGSDFPRYDTSGVDEMFPTIDPCKYPYASSYFGTKLPDHGELWTLPWTVTEADEYLTTNVQGVALPYTISRKISLDDHAIQLDYEVANIGDELIHGLWAFHGLTACDEWTRLILPQGQGVINVQDSTILGPAGTSHSFPITIGQDGKEYHLNHVEPQSNGTTKKIYVEGPVSEGQTALTLNQGQLLYTLLFPKEKVPYLGVWINEGGFKGEYNCALEPATGYYDSLEIAHEKQCVQSIKPGESIEWCLRIELTPYCNEYVDDLSQKRLDV